ncbi:MAG: phosphatidate cytidylyltransferase [Oscillospiraceae bacterium]|nr:phosphatidate cytidylyltransferase [Oscillospiraceae bacterium]
MKSRVIVAAVGVPLLLVLILLCPAWCMGILTAIMSAIAVIELLHTAGLMRNLRVICYSIAAAIGISAWSAFGTPHVWGLLIVFLYMLALIGEFLAAQTRISLSRLMAAVFAALIVPYFLSALTRMAAAQNGKYYVLLAVILSFTSDTGAFFVGRSFGKHKLAPVISPHKTVEGLIGGVISCVLCTLLYSLIIQLAAGFTVDYLTAVICGILGSLTSVAGDLTFSVIKRQAGIKDYGKLLPGHGGILDRFDSVELVAPLTELLMLSVPLITKG